MVIWNSRRPFKSALAGTGLLLSRIPTSAQDGNALLRPPRQALVIGNSCYSRAPLADPVNDAKGMTEALRSIDFEVTTGLDLARDAMQGAVRPYIEAVREAGPWDCSILPGRACSPPGAITCCRWNCATMAAGTDRCLRRSGCRMRG
jgi:hypothetical protein